MISDNFIVQHGCRYCRTNLYKQAEDDRILLMVGLICVDKLHGMCNKLLYRTIVYKIIFLLFIQINWLRCYHHLRADVFGELPSSSTGHFCQTKLTLWLCSSPRTTDKQSATNVITALNIFNSIYYSDTTKVFIKPSRSFSFFLESLKKISKHVNLSTWQCCPYFSVTGIHIRVCVWSSKCKAESEHFYFNVNLKI